MSGGAFKNSSNLLGRRREIEDIKADIVKIEEAGRKLQDCLLEKQQEKKSLEEKAEEYVKVEQQCRLNLNTERLTFNQTKVVLKNVEHYFEDISRESAEIESQGK